MKGIKNNAAADGWKWFLTIALFSTFFTTAMASDTIAPIALCKNIVLALDSNTNTAILLPQDIDNGSSDNVGIASMATIPSVFECFDAGVQQVQLIVTDSAGNSDTCTSTVTVVLTANTVIAPVCPSNITVNSLPGICGTNQVFIPITQQAPCPAVQLSSINLNTFFEVGTTTVTLIHTAVHDSTVTASCSFDVTVIGQPLTVDLGNDTTVCNNAFEIDAGAGFASYLWSNGDTSQRSFADSTGSYSVSVTQDFVHIFPGGGLLPPDTSIFTCTASDTINVTANNGFNEETSCAHLLTDIRDYCSSPGEFTNVGASSNSGSSCGSFTATVWFKFRATTEQIKIKLKVNDGVSTMRRSRLSLFDEQLGEVMCNEVPSNKGSRTNIIQSVDIIPGDIYFIQVQNDGGTHNRGSFQLCVTDSVDFDFIEGAVKLPHNGPWCSAKKAFSSFNKTFDQQNASCWNDPGHANVWFKFQATTPEVRFQLLTGGANGKLRQPKMALWDSLGNQLRCESYFNDTTNMRLQSVNLTVGDWYFVSVVDSRFFNGGSFTVCIDNKVDFDFFEGAHVLPHTGSFCSAPGEFTNLHATKDGPKPSCWGSASRNVWFKFQALKPVARVILKTGSTGGEGTISNLHGSLWDAQLNELDCKEFRYNSKDDVMMEQGELTVGAWYYISVRNSGGSNSEGTFTICLDDTVTNDYAEGALDISALMNGCTSIDSFQNNSVLVDGTFYPTTPDRQHGSCWDSTEVMQNIWFKFQVTSFIAEIDLIPAPPFQGAAGVGISSARMALYDDTFTEINCEDHGPSGNSSIFMADSTLTIGDWYYLAVDDEDGLLNHAGFFKLCLSNGAVNPARLNLQGTKSEHAEPLADPAPVRIYPNPSNGDVSIEYWTRAGGKSCSRYDGRYRARC